METNRLRAFCTIAETGSLTKASEILGMSHSGLSKAMAVLQQEIDIQLFRPAGRGLEITKEGKWFYQKALNILKIESEIAAGQISPPTELRIGLSEVLAVSLATVELVKEFNGPLKIFEADVGEIEQTLKSHQIDFGFTFSPSPIAEVDYLQIGQLSCNAYAHVNYLKSKSLNAINFIAPASAIDFNPQGYKVRDGWPQDIPRQILFQVSSFSIALNFLQNELCAVYMPDFIANNLEKIVPIKGYERARSQRKLFLAKLKNSDETTEMKKACKIMRRICD